MPLLGGGSSLLFVGRSGLVSMSVVWWVTVSSLCFGRMCGLEVCRLGSVCRLFDLSLLKEVSVFDMCQLGLGEGGEAWKWRRGLFA